MPVPLADPVLSQLRCFHCGDPVPSDGVHHDGKAFCCAGCKLVYELLDEHKLEGYYRLSAASGRSPGFSGGERFAYLDDAGVAAALLDFHDGAHSAATMRVPAMHCSACVWLLEQLHLLDEGIVASRVDFPRKQVYVRFTPRTSLRRIAELLSRLGYEPEITLASAAPGRGGAHPLRPLYMRLGVAGFCFGNIMLLSFPEYLGGGAVSGDLARVFSGLNLALSLPVLFYSAQEYFRSALAGLRQRMVNLDVPIALGILILFTRSVYDIAGGTGPGYLDSMTGLVFFLLIGRIFQAKTYDSLNFERTYTSYFPLAVAVRRETGETTLPVSSIGVGDRIILRSGDLIPADGVLMHGEGLIDYSFVTGESAPVERGVGDRVYAGGRQSGGRIEVETIRNVSQSYLTRLWNDQDERRPAPYGVGRLSSVVAKYFTAGVLALALGTALYWLPRDAGTALDAVTGVLIVACPCALALSIPFTFGTVMRYFGRCGLYLKNADVVERLARVTSLVFDKTGTLTEPGVSDVRFVGEVLSEEEAAAVVALASGSAHPLSRRVASAFPRERGKRVEAYTEIPGEGIQGSVDGRMVRLGSARFTNAASAGGVDDGPGARVYVSLDGVCRGYFAVPGQYRRGLSEMIVRLRERYRVSVLSGDAAGERPVLEEMFGQGAEMRFRQSPEEKRDFVRSLQAGGAAVAMLGDGLNDAVALRDSDVGIAVAEDVMSFTPASDAILHGESLRRVDAFLRVARGGMRIVLVSFALSFLYNIVGLGFAVQGLLSPVIAAILMPVSSVTVVVLATLSVRWIARREGMLGCRSSSS